MATNGPSLLQQKASLETRIKLLVNNDLKEICREYHYQVSGTKATLQKRVIEVMNDLVKAGDEAGFAKLNYMVAHHGQTPRVSLSLSAGASSNSHRHNNHNLNNNTASQMTNGAAYAQYGNNGYAQSHASPRAKYFKSSPFYDVKDTVMPRQELPDGPDMPQNRHTVRAVLALSPDHVRTLKDDPSMRLMLFCGVSLQMTPYQSVDVAFPNQLEVKINGDDVKHNFKGLKNKPGTTKPTDITDKVRKAQGYQNQLSITYALTKNRFAVVVHMVQMIPVETLTERLRSGKVGGIISKQRVIDEMSRASKDDDISATSVRMSLKDPVSTTRIKLPIRSTVCTHNQCFDGGMFLALQEQAPQWQCPVCNKSVPYESLCVDKYFEDILQNTPTSIEKVDIEPNGEWKVIKEEEDVPTNGASNKPRAAYDNDSDDDLIEIVDEVKPTNGHFAAARGVSGGASFSPGAAFNTPPLSSRGPSAAPSMQSATNKRPGSSVIDLTLSDDEDEPPRPAKRQTTSTHANPSGASYLPTLPDPRYRSNSAAAPPGTDSYRPSNHASATTTAAGTSAFQITRPTSASSRSATDFYPSNSFSLLNNRSSLHNGSSSPLPPPPGFSHASGGGLGNGASGGGATTGTAAPSTTSRSQSQPQHQQQSLAQPASPTWGFLPQPRQANLPNSTANNAAGSTGSGEGSGGGGGGGSGPSKSTLGPAFQPFSLRQSTSSASPAPAPPPSQQSRQQGHQQQQQQQQPSTSSYHNDPFQASASPSAISNGDAAYRLPPIQTANRDSWRNGWFPTGDSPGG